MSNTKLAANITKGPEEAIHDEVSDSDDPIEQRNVEDSSNDDVDVIKYTSEEHDKKFRNSTTDLQVSDVSFFPKLSSHPYTRKKKAERKIKRNFGLPYVTATGKLVKGRVPGQLENCRNSCRDKVPQDAIQVIHDEYWALGDRRKRVSFIASMVDTKKIIVTRKRGVEIGKERNRSITHHFHLEVNGEKVRICRGCFMKILDETNMFVTLAIKSSRAAVSCNTKNDKSDRASFANIHGEKKIVALKTV